MNAETPIQRLSQKDGVEVYVVDIDLPPMEPEHVPEEWDYLNSPEWGISRIFAHREDNATGIRPNSLLIAYSLSGIEVSEFPIDVFQGGDAELRMLGGTVTDLTTVSAPLSDGMAVSCSGTYLEGDTLLFLQYRYYVFHSPERSPVSWVVEVVDTCPYVMRNAGTVAAFSRIKETWERQLAYTLVENYAPSSQARLSAEGATRGAARKGLPEARSDESRGSVTESSAELPRQQGTQRKRRG